MKTCRRCRLPKSNDSFYLSDHNRDGRHVWCKQCFSEVYLAGKTDPVKVARRAWNNIVQRTKTHKRYQQVQVRLTKEEFLNWAIPAFTEWMAANEDLRPSVDRIEASGHYELGNIRVVDRGRNSQLARKNHNVHAPEGTAWCSSCEKYLSVDNFQANKNRFNGLQHLCKKCRSEFRREARQRSAEHR